MRRIAPQQGMVLLSTILMLTVLTMLVLSLMQAVFLYIKISPLAVRKRETLYRLEALAEQLAGVRDPNCNSTLIDPNQTIERLQKKGGCSFLDNKRRYHYLMTDLGVFPCLLIDSNNERHSSHHWLISVASAPPQQLILQIRTALPMDKNVCKQNISQSIAAGVTSWRLLG